MKQNRKRIIFLERWFEIIDQLAPMRQTEVLLMLTTALRTGAFPDYAQLVPAERQLFDDVRQELGRRAEAAERRREAARRRREERRRAQTTPPEVNDDTHRAIREYRALTESFIPAFNHFIRTFPGQKPKSEPFSLFLLQQRFPDTWPEIIPHLSAHLERYSPKRAPSFADFLETLVA